MHTKRNVGRMICSGLLIAAYFLPWVTYLSTDVLSNLGSFSAFDFARMTLTSDLSDEIIQQFLIIVITLTAIPIIALFIFIRSANKRTTHGLLRALPFILIMLLIILVVVGTMNYAEEEGEDWDLSQSYKYIGIGLYATVVASIALIFMAGPATKKNTSITTATSF